VYHHTPLTVFFISNEAWNYMGGFTNNFSFVGLLLKGFKWGFAAFVVAAGADYYIKSQHNDKKHN
jgi:NADH dehydrogenase (ubiquinone) 1 beta subcomplex subunit 3